jgi:hypothetical protein
MPLTDEAAQEVEALSAILGDDFFQDEEASCVLCVAPEAGAGEVVGALALQIKLPPGYPEQASADIVPSSLLSFLEHFPNRVSRLFVPKDEQLSDISTAIATAIKDMNGEPVIYEAVQAVQAWLEANTLASVPTDVTDDLASAMDAAEVSEDDLELDSEDVDGEMIEAIREVVGADTAPDKKVLKLLKKAESMPADTKEQRDTIRACWLALTPAQRRAMVEDSGDEDDESESESGGDEVPAAKAPKAKKTPPIPPPAQRTCKKGHALAAVNAKPADYRKLSGNEGNCDLCGKDYKYSVGGYHCDTCRDWDCCVACGSTMAAAGASKKQKKKK